MLKNIDNKTFGSGTKFSIKNLGKQNSFEYSNVFILYVEMFLGVHISVLFV